MLVLLMETKISLVDHESATNTRLTVIQVPEAQEQKYGQMTSRPFWRLQISIELNVLKCWLYGLPSRNCP